MAHVAVTGVLAANEKIRDRTEFICQLKVLLQKTLNESSKGSFDGFMAHHIQACLNMFERDYDNAAVLD